MSISRSCKRSPDPAPRIPDPGSRTADPGSRTTDPGTHPPPSHGTPKLDRSYYAVTTITRFEGCDMRSARTLTAAALVLGTAALVPIGSSLYARVSDVVQRAPAGEILDVTGHPLKPFEPSGPASVIFFIATDCPVSNSYAPEIQSICRDYAPRGVGCSLAYEDLDLTNSASRLNDTVRKHLQEFRYTDIPAVVDSSRALAKRAKASVTPAGGRGRSSRQDSVSRPNRQLLCGAGQNAPAGHGTRPACRARRGAVRRISTESRDRSPRLLHRRSRRVEEVTCAFA